MNLHTVITPTLDAKVVVALKRASARLFPRTNIWCSPAATPEVRKLRALSNGTQFVSAFPVADAALVTDADVECIAAGGTGPVFGAAVFPAMTEIASIGAILFRAVRLWAASELIAATNASPDTTSVAPSRPISHRLEGLTAAVTWLRFVRHSESLPQWQRVAAQ